MTLITLLVKLLEQIRPTQPLPVRRARPGARMRKGKATKMRAVMEKTKTPARLMRMTRSNRVVTCVINARKVYRKSKVGAVDERIFIIAHYHASIKIGQSIRNNARNQVR